MGTAPAPFGTRLSFLHRHLLPSLKHSPRHMFLLLFRCPPSQTTPDYPWSKCRGYRYKAGSYVHVNCPAISASEWHPFSLFPVPGPQERAGFHVEAVSVGARCPPLHHLSCLLCARCAYYAYVRFLAWSVAWWASNECTDERRGVGCLDLTPQLALTAVRTDSRRLSLPAWCRPCPFARGWAESRPTFLRRGMACTPSRLGQGIVPSLERTQHGAVRFSRFCKAILLGGRR